MDSLDKQAEKILQYLLEEYSEGDDISYNDIIPESDHDEQDHISESDHDTCSIPDDSDVDPDFVPGSNNTSDVEDSVDEEDISGQPTTKKQKTGVQDSNNTQQRNTVDDVIEEVVMGVGDIAQVCSPRSRNYLVGKDKKTLWKRTCNTIANVRTRSENIVKHLPGPVRNANQATTPLECFHLFVDNQIVQAITIHTNVYINKISVQYCRERDCKQTDPLEIKAFFGLLLYAGSIRSGHQNLRELWSKDGTGLEIFYGIMSFNRFIFLLKSIRFDNINDRGERRKFDKFAPFREVFKLFVNNCDTHYSLGEFVTIDEQLVPFRGRCSFRQYMKSKPAKYGLKVLTMTDAKTYYVKTMEVYLGKQPEGSPYEVSNRPSDVVLRLVKTIENSGRNITADNWFTSIPLVNQLLNKKLTYVGTVRKDKVEIPPVMTSKKREAYDTIFGFQEKITLLSYAPKQNRSVILVSSFHHDDHIDESTGIQRKPYVITFYNNTKSGVDIVDKKCGTYSTSRRSNRWPLVLFYRLLDIAGVNAQIIYLFNNPTKPILRRLFLKEIAIELVKPLAQSRCTIQTLPKNIRQSARIVAGLGQGSGVQGPVKANDGQKRKARCTICPRNKDIKVKTSCEMCKIPMCMSHMKTVCEGCLIQVNDESD
uniref:PiggyBac transposable element-derived protein domain-containing protein n=1 Tax=Clastoptera arizonana TaxID=38151 RepID=A0A1B6E2X5_9HEMI